MSLLTMAVTKLNEHEETALNKFITRLQAVYADKLYGVVLFGSKARGDAISDSDIDLLIIMSSDDWPTRDGVTQIASRISLSFDILISTHVVSLSRWLAMANDPFTFYQNLFAEGIPLFGTPDLFAPLNLVSLT